MAKVIPVGEPVNDAERRAIAHLRDCLSDSYLLVHNFEIERNGELFEVDIAVIAPHAVYLVDVKGTRGRIDVSGRKWYPAGRQPYTSPLLKLRGHAKTLKGLITELEPNRRELQRVYVDAVILLSEPDARLQDPSGRDGPSVTTLAKSASFFQDKRRIPGQFANNIGAQHKHILKALQANGHKPTGPLVFGNWAVSEKLGGTDAYTEYRGHNHIAGPSSGLVRMRVYQADPYLPDDERKPQTARISNAYRALNSMPGHPGLVGARAFFEEGSGHRYVLVTEDVEGEALGLRIGRHGTALTVEQKLAVAQQLLTALAHAHKHCVVHRNLTPDAVMVTPDGTVRITGFDFARAGTDRSMTLAEEIVDDLDQAYQAPEAYKEPSQATAASDVFSAGLVLYELFTDEPPFASTKALFELGAVFPLTLSRARAEFPAELDPWLQSLCAFDADERPTAENAARVLRELRAINDEPSEDEADRDYHNLAAGTELTRKLVVEKRLGKPGSFGVVYKVVDTLGDVARAVKLILRDRTSVVDRLKTEYKTLLRIPRHPNVVEVIDADFLPGSDIPYIVFEYIEGLDVGELIETKCFAPEDVLELGRQVLDGLVHLHDHRAYHCDIKPRNLMWTDKGTRIIDFNVSVLAAIDEGHGGGTRRYLPPDADFSGTPADEALADRDLYALGITLYEATVNGYPWSATSPPPAASPMDPRKFTGYSNLAPDFCNVLLKAIAPHRYERYATAREFQVALNAVQRIRRPTTSAAPAQGTVSPSTAGTSVPPNTNPFVAQLLTLYSQSNHTNAGTRGLDDFGRQTYVETTLDRQLLPAVLDGEFKLVVITGNAGDGKTAFLQQLEKQAQAEQAIFEAPLPNGRSFKLRGQTFLTNYDGSQDEGEQSSDDVLLAFFEPYRGDDTSNWTAGETRAIAINEGRLVDFLASHGETFGKLSSIVAAGLTTGSPSSGVAIVNLNLRSVVADPERNDDDPLAEDNSIFARSLRRMTADVFWEPCESCDLKEKCYVLHNAKTFQDDTAGPKVLQRLRTLYTLTHLRERLHITLRDLRSALAYTIAGTRNCDEIHQLYRDGNRDAIAQGLYFNSWMGGDHGTSDRLLTLLKDVDIGLASDPTLDRALDFVSPDTDRGLFRLDGRGDYDGAVLKSLFDSLPRDYTGHPSENRAERHRAYVAMVRRRAYFERRDAGWHRMLPYRSARAMLDHLRRPASLAELLPTILNAVSRGEGLSNTDRLEGRLALRVRKVVGGTIRSYRLFDGDRFRLTVADADNETRFVEQMPSSLQLTYSGTRGVEANLQLTLDVLEMLMRLESGYRPSIEEEQGYYLSLTVFKNVLGSEPYQQVLLTTTGHDFYRVVRHPDGRLEMQHLHRKVA